MTSKQKSDKFYQSADSATRAKVNFVSYYLGIYFGVINNTRNALQKSSKIKYVDLFAGRGKFDDGFQSVPLNLLEMLKKGNYENIELFFNDKFQYQYLKENIEKIYPDFKFKITCENKDIKDICLTDIIKSNDIIISYVDPFGYLGVEPSTIKLLINNKYSDCLFFLNLNWFFRFLENKTEEVSVINFFGTQERLKDVLNVISNSNLSRDEKLDLFVKQVIQQIQNEISNKIFVLPVFFKQGHEFTSVYNCLFLVSKSMKGLDAIRNTFSSLDSNVERMSKINANIHVENGRYFVWESNLNIFDFYDNNDLFVEEICSLMPNEYVSRDELLHIIDEKYINKYGYVSAYNTKILNYVLNKLESEGKLLISKIDDDKKRRKKTFPDYFKFKLKLE